MMVNPGADRSANQGAAARPPTPVKDVSLVQTRREAALVLIVWLIACIYSVGYCGLFGYNRPARDIVLVLGFPDWVFWGIVVPWLACTLVSYLIAQFYMRDEIIAPEGDDMNDEF
jgi:hypothetical protein